MPAGGSQPQSDRQALSRVLRRPGGGDLSCLCRRYKVAADVWVGFYRIKHQPRHGAAGQVRPRDAGQLLMIAGGQLLIMMVITGACLQCIQLLLYCYEIRSFTVHNTTLYYCLQNTCME
jgi:hypothetical protein